MAQSLGIVTKRENGGYEGTLAMMTLNTKITIVPNEAKENERQPDFRIYAARGNEIGGGWKSRREKLRQALRLAHPRAPRLWRQTGFCKPRPRRRLR